MKHFVLIFITFSLSIDNLTAQVSGVNYSVEYNKATELFDCYLHIIEGSTRLDKPADRIQFNSQFSLVSHAGVAIEIVERYMPLVDNLDYNGTEPMGWQIFNRLNSPDEAPGLNFYTIGPKLSPTSQYADLAVGDKVKLFSLNATPTDTCTYKLRMFDNVDDGIIVTGNGDYRNGFSVGGISLMYIGNVDDSFIGGDAPLAQFVGDNEILVAQNTEVSPTTGGVWHSSDDQIATITNDGIVTGVNEGNTTLFFSDAAGSCNSKTLDLVVKLPANISDLFDEVEIYPNPTNGIVSITGLTDFTQINVLDLNGDEVSIEFKDERLDLSSIPNGVYFIKIKSGTDAVVRKINKIN